MESFCELSLHVSIGFGHWVVIGVFRTPADINLDQLEKQERSPSPA